MVYLWFLGMKRRTISPSLSSRKNNINRAAQGGKEGTRSEGKLGQSRGSRKAGNEEEVGHGGSVSWVPDTRTNCPRRGCYGRQRAARTDWSQEFQPVRCATRNSPRGGWLASRQTILRSRPTIFLIFHLPRAVWPSDPAPSPTAPRFLSPFTLFAYHRRPNLEVFDF